MHASPQRPLRSKRRLKVPIAYGQKTRLIPHFDSRRSRDLVLDRAPQRVRKAAVQIVGRRLTTESTRTRARSARTGNAGHQAPQARQAATNAGHQ